MPQGVFGQEHPYSQFITNTSETETPEVLSNDIDEKSAQLETAVSKIKKSNRDGLHHRHYLKHGVPAMKPILFGSVAGETALIASGRTGSVIFVAGLQGAMVLESHTADRKAKQMSPMELDDGYTLQSFAAKSPYDDTNEVLTAVHPRVYSEGEREQPQDTRRRLAEALTVIAGTKSIDRVLLPGSLARMVVGGAPQRSYKQTVADLTGRDLMIPYDKSESCILLSRESVEHIAESLAGDQPDQLGSILQALYRRFPSLLEKQQAGDKTTQALQKNVSMLLRRTLDAELPGAQRERYHDRHGNYYDQRTPLMNVVSSQTSPDDIQVAQHRLPTYESIEHKRLTKLLGIVPWHEQPEQIAYKLQTNEYSDLQLIALTLHALDKVTDDKEAELHDEETATPTPDTSAAANVITLSEKKDKREIQQQSLRFVRRVIGKAAVAATAMIGIGTLGLVVGAAASEPKTVAAVAAPRLNNNSKVGVGQQETDIYPMWRVEAHGPQVSGYYASATAYDYNVRNADWEMPMGSNYRAELQKFPDRLPDQGADHITISGWIVDGGSTLPIRENTVLGAIRAKNAKGEPATIKVVRYPDGIYEVLSDPAAGELFVEYDLIPTTEPTVHATGPVVVKNPASGPVLPRSIDAFREADYTANEFTYDNTPLMQGILKRGSTASEVAKAVYQEQRCNCGVCATAVALIGSGHGDHIAMTSGYNNQEDNPDGFLSSKELHAWLTDERGRIIDATPYKFDSQSGPQLSMADSEQRKIWDYNMSVMQSEGEQQAEQENDERKRQLFLYGLGIAAMGAAAMITGPAVYRFGKRRWEATGDMVRNHVIEQSIGSADSILRLLAWEAYGDTDKHNNPAWTGGKAIRPDNLPDDVLQRAQRGELKFQQHLSKAQNTSVNLLVRDILRNRTQPAQ
jgi:hypothetical protein